MSNTFNARIRNKMDTSSNWTAQNPVLLEGEIISVLTNSGDTRHKTGDGESTYTQLPFDDEYVIALVNDKQETLTAGTNITIENNVISAAGGDPEWGSF